jgi:hypothetical protein
MQIYGGITINDSDRMFTDEFDLFITMHNSRLKELEAKKKKGSR